MAQGKHEEKIPSQRKGAAREERTQGDRGWWHGKSIPKEGGQAESEWQVPSRLHPVASQLGSLKANLKQPF